MKNIYLSIVFLFAVLLSVNFVSAGTCIGGEFTYSVIGIKPSSNLDLGKIMGLCILENCNIDRDAMTLTIQSHYDNRVALIFSQFLDKNELVIETFIPYELNESQGYYNGCPYIIKEIDPKSYSYKESIKTDLTYLKNLEILDISDSEIEKISEVGDGAINCNGIWKSISDCEICDQTPELCGMSLAGESIFAFPTLPAQEFSLTQNSSSLIYWIVGIILVVVILALFLMRKKK